MKTQNKTIKNTNRNSVSRRMTFTIICSIATLFSFAQNSVVLYYDSDEFKITEEHENIINQNITKFKKAPIIFIEGHTDSDANQSYNLELSEKRARAAAQYVNNVARNKDFKVRYFGEQKSLNANRTQKEKSLNRRVELFWEYNEKWTENESGLSSLTLNTSHGIKADAEFSTLHLDSDVFKIDRSKNYKIITPKDITFIFPADTFSDASEFSLTESTNQKDMLDNSFNTMMEDGILESTYMYCLETKGNDLDEIFQVQLPKEHFEKEGRGWYKKVDDVWVDQKITTSDYYQDTCDCYVMEVKAGCYNVDMPIEANEVLMADYDSRTKIKSYLFGLFSKYDNLKPTFYFFPEDVNAGILPTEVSKKEITFSDYNSEWNGRIIGIATYKGETFIAEQLITTTNYQLKRKKMKFNKVEEEEYKMVLAKL